MVFARFSLRVSVAAFAVGGAAGACGHDSSGPSAPGVVATSGSEAGADSPSPVLTDVSVPPVGSSSDADSMVGAEGAAESGGGGDGTVAVPDAMGGGIPHEGGEAGALAWVCPPGPFGNPIPAGAATIRIPGVPPSDAFNMNNGTFGILEGPVWISDALYLSEIGAGPNPPASRILKFTPDGVVSVAIASSGTNGLAIDKYGNLYGAVHKDGSISRFDLSTGMATPVVSTFMNARFNSPNDVTIKSDGTIFFSDPDYQAPSTRPQQKTRLYRVPPGSSTAIVVDANLSEPNGVTFSLDESTLYVTTPGALYKYPVLPDGSTGTGSTVLPTVPSGDGMTLDCAGNLYIATPNNVVVLNPSGAEIGRIPVTGGVSATNVAFGGADHKTLYITALGSGTLKGLLQVTLGIPGRPF